MKSKRLLFILSFLFLMPLIHAQEEKFKALFIYNFTKYLEWPESKQKGDFIIGVYGNSSITNELNIIAQKRKIGNQQIVILNISGYSEFVKCSIVYITESRSNEVSEIAKICQGKGVVILTDKPGLAKKYAGLNYIKVDGKLNFEINRKHLEEQGIKVNTALLSLGINIE